MAVETLVMENVSEMVQDAFATLFETAKKDLRIRSLSIKA